MGVSLEVIDTKLYQTIVSKLELAKETPNSEIRIACRTEPPSVKERKYELVQDIVKDLPRKDRNRTRIRKTDYGQVFVLYWGSDYKENWEV